MSVWGRSCDARRSCAELDKWSPDIHHQDPASVLRKRLSGGARALLLTPPTSSQGYKSTTHDYGPNPDGRNAPGKRVVPDLKMPFGSKAEMLKLRKASTTGSPTPPCSLWSQPGRNRRDPAGPRNVPHHTQLHQPTTPNPNTHQLTHCVNFNKKIPHCSSKTRP